MSSTPGELDRNLATPFGVEDIPVPAPGNGWAHFVRTLREFAVKRIGARGFAWIATAMTVYTCLTIVFGAYVRASFSGAGCGNSWPNCGGGSLVPDLTTAGVPKIIEFTHRSMSGPLSLFLLVSVVLAYLLYPKKSAPRRAATYAVVFTVTEALFGAALVKYGWVMRDHSNARAVVMPIHLMNTYLLLANMAMMAFFGFTGKAVTWKNQGATGSALKAIAVSMFVLGCSGAISALGKSAYGVEMESARTLAERLAVHFGPDAPALLRGGALHPFVATSIGFLGLWLLGVVYGNRPSPMVRKAAQATLTLYLIQFGFGVWNLLASAPVWMQLLHLGLAVLTWVSIVVLSAFALGAEHAVEPPAEQVELRSKRTPRDVVKALVAVTKPRIISLLLFTTIAAMFAAQHGWPDWRLLLAVLVGGYFSAGAANAFNMVVETDLDGAMERTSHRPSVTGVLSLGEITAFAWIAASGSFALLWASANLLTACMALCGLLTYVFVYTLWLKRRTWHNIVIGGAAGAFPPLVGWASVTNSLSPLAWFLFALIFTWTPVHFWALALLIKDDYAKANVPMLPVVKGDRVTVIQIMLYAVVTALICIVPFAQRAVGPVYLVGAVLLNGGLLVQSLKLLKNPEKVQARALFKFSMAYLALIFIVVAVDKAVGVS